jgi:hypothetical protein
MLSKEQAQRLIQELQKVATPFGGTLGPSKPSPASTPHPGTSQPRSSSIADMQKAMQSLAQAVTSQLNLSKLQGPNPDKQEAEGRDSFADFFTKHYLRNTDVPSVELDPNPAKVQMSDKDPRTPSKLNWVMDTMRRVGNERQEAFVDGSWGPRTNIALINSYALAEGLLNLAKEFKLPVREYSEKDLAGLKPAVRQDNDLTPQEKAKVAPIVARHLQAIKRMYNEVKQGILEKPQWRAYIENDKPYIQYNNPVLNPQQVASLQQTFPDGWFIPVDKQGGLAHLDVDNLASSETLKQWMEESEIKLSPYNVVRLVMDQLIQPGSS